MKIPSIVVFSAIVAAGALTVACAGDPPAKPPPAPEVGTETNTAPSAEEIAKMTDEDWKKRLTPEQFRILRQAGTERPWGAAYREFKAQGAGTYHCAGCDAELFHSKTKFDSHCGWPSFYDPADAKNVTTHEDRAFGMVRVEVRCAKCDGHLGHVFKGEGFAVPNDTRYCINGVSLKFVPDKEADADEKDE